MDLNFRAARPADLATCLPCARDAFAHTEAERAELLALWRALLAEHACRAEIIEDCAAPPPARVVYFAVTVFISDEFSRALQHGPAPFAAKQALAWRRRGEAPILGAAQVRADNSAGGAGLTLLCLNSGGPDWVLTTERGRAVVHKQPEWILRFWRGYRLNEMLIESYGPFQCRWSLSAGLRLRNSYDAYQQDRPGLPADHRPFLHGLSRAEAADGSGSLVSPLFTSDPPQFFFGPSEQALLQRALVGESDREIADALGITLFTIHKRWRGIYERVAERHRTLLPETTGEAGRGVEKRAVLLRYLQHHPEELRPVSPPPRGGRG